MRIYVEPILNYLKTKVQNLHFYDRSSSISLLATFWNTSHVKLAKIITTNSNYYLQMVYLRSSKKKLIFFYFCEVPNYSFGVRPEKTFSEIN